MKKISSIFLIIVFAFLLGFQSNSLASNKGEQKSKKPILSKTAANPAQSVISVNNISTWVGNNGFHDWVVASSWNGAFPSGTSVGAIFAEGIVWGGKVSDGASPLVRVNGNTYGSGCAPITRLYRVRPDYKGANLSKDASVFFSKPLADVTDGDIQQLKDQYETDWNEWPADEGALYEDVDGNGQYDPTIDIPGIPGASQTIFIKYDDSKSTSNYGSSPIGLEVSETYWAYASSGALGNVIYKKVDIVYKGTSKSAANSKIDSMYIVQWSDPDVGASTDDFAGCDTTLNLGYAYNSSPVDATYEGIGSPPPAAGYDFLQGVSEFTGNPADSAIFNLKWRKGYKYINPKPMSSFEYFAAGGTWSDPGFDYDGTLEFYNLMRGRLPIPRYPSGDAFPSSVADVTPFGTYLTSGDPVAGTGKIDGAVDTPGDRRLMVTNGPITMTLGDTAQVVVALVGAIGNSNLNSITKLKSNDQTAQLLFDNLFQLPSIKPPKVNVVNLDKQIILDWSDLSNVTNLETFEDQNYKFEGYEVYQLPSPSATFTDGVILASFDKVNGVTKIYDEVSDANGTPIPTLVVDGNDNGIQRYLSINKDDFRKTELRNGQTYYFAVVSYAYNQFPDLPFHALKSSLVILSAVPQQPLGERFGAEYADSLMATHSDGLSNGSVITRIIDPKLLTGNTYEVTFNRDTLTNITTWNLTDKTTNVVKLKDQLNQRADFASPVVDGVQFMVATQPENQFDNFLVVANASGTLDPPDGGANNKAGFPSPDIDDNQQVGAGHWAIHTDELSQPRPNFQDFLGNVLLNDDSTRAFPDDWEIRFTGTSWAVRVTDGAVLKVPFELWNIGFNTPDDNSDDYRLIPWIFDTDNSGTFNLSSKDHTTAADTTDWYTDLVTWRIPVDSSPGTAGYDAFVAAIDTVTGFWGAYDFLGENAMENMVLVNIGAGVIPNQDLPENGTIFRINTTKWNTPNDKFTITVPKNTSSTATVKEDANKVNVFPNPYYGTQYRETSRGDHYVTFNHLPSTATIRIFDLSGVLVKTINHISTNGQFDTWNLQNESGYPVASGIYIVYVDMPQLGKTKILKLAILQENQILQVY